VFEPDADHLHHRLLRRGFTPRGALILLYGVAAAFAALSLVTTLNPRYQVVGLIVIVLAAIAWMAIQALGGPGVGARSSRAAQRASGLPHAALLDLGPRLAGAEDVESLWRALVEAAEGLGLCTLELRLEGHETVGALGARSYEWRSIRKAPAGVWSWKLPLGLEGRRLGELSLSSVAFADDGPDLVAVRSVLQEDVVSALERMRTREASRGGGRVRPAAPLTS
jgi:UDP-GlcNAc:undecaprenyl-phosphate GlcNAc-1-phosphate transferase